MYINLLQLIDCNNDGVLDMKLTGKNILVTGGAGFIGSNLVDSLLTDGNRVSVLDNFSTGKMENIQHNIGRSDFELITGDIRDYETCKKATAGKDVVFHEAALGSVPRSIKDPMTSTAVNVVGFVNMLFAAHENVVKRFVYAASSSTYGDSKTLPKVEDKIGKPLSPYAITKYVDELFAGNFHDLYGIDVVGLRYFNVFGQRQDPDGAYAAVIPKFALALIGHNPPTINGDGSYSRDFTYIENVIQANKLAALADNPAALNTVYNVAFGERTTLNELYGFLRAALGKHDAEIFKLEAKYGPNRAGDIPHSLADITKARTLLGYEPKFSVRQGLLEAAKWYFEYLSKRVK